MTRLDVIDLVMKCDNIDINDITDEGARTRFADRKDLVETKIQKILKLVNPDALDQYEFLYLLYAHTGEGVEMVYPEWEIVCVKIGNWETYIDISEDISTDVVAKILTVL